MCCTPRTPSRRRKRRPSPSEAIQALLIKWSVTVINATIVGARAGEAGRGFAVVALEVKALAEQTAKATGEIGQQISGIQAATQESVGAIKEIGGTIERLSEIASTIAAAVEEQGAATQEISRNVQQAAQGTQQVSSNIVNVQRGATETGSASSKVLSAARSLAGDSTRLKVEVQSSSSRSGPPDGPEDTASALTMGSVQYRGSTRTTPQPTAAAHTTTQRPL